MAKSTGNFLALKFPVPRTVPNAAHAAAAAMHGWDLHAYHEAKPLELSEADYLAALAAASKGERHPAALSKYAPPRRAERLAKES